MNYRQIVIAGLAGLSLLSLSPLSARASSSGKDACKAFPQTCPKRDGKEVVVAVDNRPSKLEELGILFGAKEFPVMQQIKPAPAPAVTGKPVAASPGGRSP